MIYKTTIISGSGGRYQDARGNILTAIGRQNVYTGKEVWTDGKIIYGYDVPSYIARKVIKRLKKQYHEFVYDVSTSRIYGYRIATDSRIYLNKARSGNALIASGKRLYNVEVVRITGDPDNYYKFVYTDIVNNISVDVLASYSSSFSLHKLNADFGRNGGVLASSDYNAYLDLQYDFVYYIYETTNAQNQKELHVNKIMTSALYQEIQNVDSRIGSGGTMSLFCLNVADDGTGTAIVQIYYNGDYYEYLLTFTPNGMTISIVSASTITIPVGDAMLTLGWSAISGLSTIGTAVVDNNVSLIINYYSKVTKTADGLFVLSPFLYDSENYFEFDMYDLQGNFVRHINDSVWGFIYGNNCRLDLCDVDAQATAWGFT